MIFPLTRKEEEHCERITRKMKSKQEKINVLLSSGCYKLDETNIMSEAEAKELFAWFNGEILRGGSCD